MERRQLLQGGAAAGILGATAVAIIHGLDDGDRGRNGDRSTDTPPTATDRDTDRPEPTDEEPVRYADAFGTVVDAVEAGADPTGSEPIGDVLTEYAADDTLLSFPEGTYLLPQIELTEYDRLGIAAATEARPTFRAPKGSCVDKDPHIQFGRVTDFLLDGVDFDFRRPGAGGAINVIASGDATVRDVTARGTCRQQVTMFRMDIRNPDAEGLVERFRAENVQDSGWMTGAYVGKRHSGSVTFRDCELSEFTDNGLYGSAPGTDGGGGGEVHTVGGHFRNNNVSNIRLGTAGSSARSDTIVVESAPEAESINLRGIRLRRGGDQLVEDCEVRFGPDAANSFGAVVFHADNAGARVRDSTITVDSDAVPAVRAFYHSGDPGGLTLENLTVDGGASRGYAVRLNGRNGATIRNCDIDQSGAQRDGIRFAYSEDCRLIDSRIDVSGYPLILRDATVRIENTTLVTPDGERHIDEMDAGPNDFRPGTWT